MGRNSTYNRLGNADKDYSHSDANKRKEKHNQKNQCPPYSDLYAGYDSSDEERTQSFSKDNLWINRLLCTDDLSVQAMTCQVYSSCRSDNKPNNTECDLLKGAVKQTKIFNFMKEFFRRKVLQQHNDHSEGSHRCTKKSWKNFRDATSDFDDVDIMDSSYNADEEDDDEAGEASDDCTCVIPRSKAINRKPEKLSRSQGSPLRAAFTLNCWQQRSETDTTSTSSPPCTDSEEHKISSFKEFSREKSIVSVGNMSEDAGISDCCQLIVKSPKKSQAHGRRSNRKVFGKRTRHFKTITANANADYDHDDDDDDSDEGSDLLKSSWYQPRITTKAAYERLQQSSPGSFLIRRKARTFQLCLRSETKVKHFTVIGSNESFKLKGAKKQFSSLKALVTHHSVMAEQLPLTLLLPREKQPCVDAILQRYDDDFDTFESLQVLGILKSLQGKNFDSS